MTSMFSCCFTILQSRDDDPRQTELMVLQSELLLQCLQELEFHIATQADFKI